MLNSASRVIRKKQATHLLRENTEYLSGMSSIPIEYTGNPPKAVKAAFTLLIPKIMADIEKEIIENNGAILVHYDGKNGLEFRAASNNPDVTMKMTIKLQGAFLIKKMGLN